MRLHCLARAGIIALTSMLGPCVPILAGPAETCAALAASPHETGSANSGVDQFDMDVEAAIAACSAAVASDAKDITAHARLARAYYIGKRYGEMYPHVEIAAAAGNAMAQQLLGDALVSGHGIARDLKRSIGLLEASAAQDYAPGIYSLGVSYRYGDGVAVDLSKAAALFARAADKDYSWALGDLGVMTLKGEGVPQNTTAAIALLERAANQGDAFAMIQLGDLYAGSELVPTDAPKALGYYLNAEARGDHGGTASAAYLYMGVVDGVAADYPLARQMAQRAADAGHGSGSYVLGYMAEHGLGMAKDIAAAQRHYEQGAARMDALSRKALAQLTNNTPR